MMNKQYKLLVVLCLVVFSHGCASHGSYDFGDFSQAGEPAPTLSEVPHARNILILGGNSGIGLETTKLALQRGHSVTVVSRNPSGVDLEHTNLSLVAGNILNPESMRSIIPGHDVVISAIGLPAGSRNVTLFSEGIKNIMPVMQATNIQRLLTISAIGAGDSEDHGGFWFDWLLHPWILADDIADKTRQEELIRNSALAFTIVRPAVLTDEPAMNNYRVIQNLNGIETGKIARADVAAFLVASIEQGLYLRKTVVLSD